MKTIRVCCGTGCLANGSKAVAEAFEEKIKALGAPAEVECEIKRTGCNGFCENGPLVTIVPDNISYYHVKPADADEIIEKTIMRGEPVERLLYKNDKGERVLSQQDNPFYAPQMKIALRNIGKISPASVDDYISAGGYEALKKAVNMTPEEIISEIEASGLRGRGGAGFPTGTKWRTAAGYDIFPKYVACNGDEGDPGAFMDRSILEGDPHSVLEGLAICALAIGAEEGFLYIRDEYSLAVHNIKEAIRCAEEAGMLGDNILGTGRKLKLSVVGAEAHLYAESPPLSWHRSRDVSESRGQNTSGQSREDSGTGRLFLTMLRLWQMCPT